ncbi:MAG: DUF4412 domain-containing protein [Gammaproteobacteria bacterium]|nr:DUF4412 domain-containing protein [Gammaproteobacteria bacterium]
MLPIGKFGVTGVLVWVCGASLAGELPVSQVDYSATRVIDAIPGPFISQIHVSGGKERTETTMGGQRMITIIRRDRNTAWLLMPSSRTYQEIEFKTAAAPYLDALFAGATFKEVAREQVDGTQAIKYRAVLDDNAVGGFVWISEQGIPLRAERAQDPRSGQPALVLTLQNLKIGQQDVTLFELPPDYRNITD